MILKKIVVLLMSQKYGLRTWCIYNKRNSMPYRKQKICWKYQLLTRLKFTITYQEESQKDNSTYTIHWRSLPMNAEHYGTCLRTWMMCSAGNRYFIIRVAISEEFIKQCYKYTTQHLLYTGISRHSNTVRARKYGLWICLNVPNMFCLRFMEIWPFTYSN